MKALVRCKGRFNLFKGKLNIENINLFPIIFFNNYIRNVKVNFNKLFSEKNSCNNSGCGCHSNDNNPNNSSNTKSKSKLEDELKSKSYKIVECINSAKYDEALEISDELINILKINYGDDHPFYLSALNNKAFILKTCGEFEEAESIFIEVSNKYSQIYGEENEKVIITLHNLATLLKDSKELEKSLAIYEKILAIIKNKNLVVEGEKTGNLRLNIIANIYNSAGGLYRQLKNYKESDYLFSLAYNIIKENYGENTLPMSTVLNNMGISLKDQNKFDEAMEKYNKALKIREELLPKDHPEIMMTKHNIEQLNNEMNLLKH